jgi:hypothetical protein
MKYVEVGGVFDLRCFRGSDLHADIEELTKSAEFKP